MVINLSYIKCSDKVTNVYHETIQPRYYNYDIDFFCLPNLLLDDTIQFSTFRFTDNIKSQDSWTNDKQNCIAIDIDDGMSIKEFRDIFKDNMYILYTTKSHQKEKKGIVCDRFRVIIPATNIPKDEELYFAMMEELSKLLPIDKQVNTKTGSFLGNCGEVFTNEGKVYDCSFLLGMAEYRVANQKKAKEVKHRKRMEKLEQVVYDLNVKDIKNHIDGEDVIEILLCLGYEVDTRKRKFKLREDERTDSCLINSNGYLYDYGSGWKGDILDVIQDTLNIGFKESMKYVENYLKEKNDN